jgi:hypothetical protein
MSFGCSHARIELASCSASPTLNAGSSAQVGFGSVIIVSVLLAVGLQWARRGSLPNP